MTENRDKNITIIPETMICVEIIKSEATELRVRPVKLMCLGDSNELESYILLGSAAVLTSSAVVLEPTINDFLLSSHLTRTSNPLESDRIDQLRYHYQEDRLIEGPMVMFTKKWQRPADMPFLGTGIWIPANRIIGQGWELKREHNSNYDLHEFPG